MVADGARTADSSGEVEAFLRGRRAVCFDYYNTLVVDDRLPPPLWHRLRERGYPASEELQAMFEPDAFDGRETPRLGGRPCHGDWLTGNWRRFFRLCGVPADETDPLLEELLAEQRQFTTKLAPGALDALDGFKRLGWKVGLCSNWESSILPDLARDGIDPDTFDCIVTSAEVGARKPHEKVFQAAGAGLGARPEATVFVGDNWRTDVTGALRAGFAPVWVRYDRGGMTLSPLVLEIGSLEDLAIAARRL